MYIPPQQIPNYATDLTVGIVLGIQFILFNPVPRFQVNDLKLIAKLVKLVKY